MDISSQLTASAIDPKLVVRVAKGDHQALSQLYDQSSTVLFSLALRILGSREEAADVLQEIYLDIWKKAVRYDIGRGTPIAWLITLTRSRAVDRLRARGSRAPRQMNPSPAHAETSQAGDQPSRPFNSPADQDLRNRIHEAWANLPQVQRRVIELAYYEGLSNTEIAAQIDQPVETVKAGIALGLSQLRESLHAHWEQEQAV
jgi:RNA polymerase sigma-70 factor, ECF subfamily